MNHLSQNVKSHLHSIQFTTLRHSFHGCFSYVYYQNTCANVGSKLCNFVMMPENTIPDDDVNTTPRYNTTPLPSPTPSIHDILVQVAPTEAPHTDIQDQPTTIEPPRQQWGSRVSFLFASIGAAIGFGNFFRFPYLVFSSGGGAFLMYVEIIYNNLQTKTIFLCLISCRYSIVVNGDSNWTIYEKRTI